MKILTTNQNINIKMDLESISLLTEFDELVRNEKILNEGAEKEFLKFVKSSQSKNSHQEVAEQECQRLSLQLSEASHEIVGLEMKLKQARDLLDNETQARKRAEGERDKLQAQFDNLKRLIFETDGVDEGTLRKVKNFESFQVNDGFGTASLGGGGGYGNVLSPGLMREAANCRRRSTNMTDGSVLDVDDLSFDETVNLCESRTRAGTRFNKTDSEARESRKRSRSIPRIEIRAHDSSPERSRKKERRSRSVGISNKVEVLEITPRVTSSASDTSSASQQQHTWDRKTEVKSNKCSACGKRIKLGKIYHRCRHCRVAVHPECETRLGSGCVGIQSTGPPSASPSKVSFLPSGYLTRTPSKKESNQRPIFESPMLN